MNEEKPLPVLPPSRSLDREVWVGIFVILGIAAILTALFTLTDAALFRGRYIVQTQVDNAVGIRRGDPVQMRGVNIGRVTSFKIVPQGVMVQLEIGGEYLIPADSRVELRSTGMLGGMVANVIPGQSDQRVPAGIVLPGSLEEGAFDQLDELQTQAQNTLVRVQQLFDPRAIENVHQASDDFRTLLAQLNKAITQQQGELMELTRSLRRSAAALEETVHGPEIGRSLQRIDEFTARLAEIASSLERSAHSTETIVARIDSGKGSLGKLTVDEALYDNTTGAAASLKTAADELAALVADIRTRPERYVRLSLF